MSVEESRIEYINWKKKVTRADATYMLLVITYLKSVNTLLCHSFATGYSKRNKSRKTANEWEEATLSLSLSGTDSFINFHHFRFMFIRSLTSSLSPSLSLTLSLFVLFFSSLFPFAVCVLVKTFSIFYVLFVLRFAYCSAVLNLQFLIVTTTTVTTKATTGTTLTTTTATII